MKRTISLLTLLLAVSMAVFTSCNEAPAEKPAVEPVVMSSEDVSMVKGETFQLQAMIMPEDAEPQQKEWSVDNSNVTVSQEGLVTAVEAGTSVVTFTADGIAASCNINIASDVILPESVKIIPDKIEVNIGKFYQLDFGIMPKDATDKSLEWKSLDENIVIIDQKGQIKGVGMGEADVVAVTSNGKEGKCHVTVVGKRIESFELMFSGCELAIGEMETQLIAEILPEDADDKTLIWTSDDDNVATVEWSEEGQYAIMTGVGEGYIQVHAQAASNLEIVRNTWVQVGPARPVPYRLGWDWILIDCEFRVNGDQLTEEEYINYLQEEKGMSATAADARADMLERYVAYNVKDMDTKDYLILKVTTEEGNVYEAVSTSVKQVRQGYEIYHYDAVYDLSSAPQEVQDRFTDQHYAMNDMEGYWEYEVEYPEYDVEVVYVWRPYGTSILDK